MLKTPVALALAATLLAGCAAVNYKERTTNLNDAFADSLRQEYIALSDYENQQGDVFDAAWYGSKIDQLFTGYVPSPVSLENRDIPVEHLNELAGARNSLVSALSRGAAQSQPAAAAKAQAMFDCWVEQQEENFQPEDIARCRAGFNAAMQQLKPAPQPVKGVVAQLPAEFIVFFEFDSAGLTPGAQSVLNELVGEVVKLAPNTIRVEGHADTSGDLAYNQKLSEKRADAVKAYLATNGLPAGAIAEEAFGETKPRVSTEDGVKEAGNRFVRIIFLP